MHDIIVYHKNNLQRQTGIGKIWQGSTGPKQPSWTVGTATSLEDKPSLNGEKNSSFLYFSCEIELFSRSIEGLSLFSSV
jgi:hypothetical protein